MSGVWYSQTDFLLGPNSAILCVGLNSTLLQATLALLIADKSGVYA
jgi:hypothetical protein